MVVEMSVQGCIEFSSGLHSGQFRDILWLVQMKVESMVLVSCVLLARASNSCLIRADFSCSSWVILSLLSVTSCVRRRFWSFSLWMACGGAGAGGWELLDRAVVCELEEGNDGIPEQDMRSLRQRFTS